MGFPSGSKNAPFKKKKLKKRSKRKAPEEKSNQYNSILARRTEALSLISVSMNNYTIKLLIKDSSEKKQGIWKAFRKNIPKQMGVMVGRKPM